MIPNKYIPKYYQESPPPVQAMLYDGTKEGAEAIEAWIKSHAGKGYTKKFLYHGDFVLMYMDNSHDKWWIVKEGHYIVKNNDSHYIRNEETFFPMLPDDFQRKYNEV